MNTIFYSICPEICEDLDCGEVQFTLSLDNGCSGLNDDDDAIDEVYNYMDEHYPDFRFSEEAECVYTTRGISINELRNMFANDPNMREEDYEEYFGKCEICDPDEIMQTVYDYMDDDEVEPIVDVLGGNAVCTYWDNNHHVTVLLTINNVDYDKFKHNYQIFIDVNVEDVDEDPYVSNVNACYVNGEKLQDDSEIPSLVNELISDGWVVF